MKREYSKQYLIEYNRLDYVNSGDDVEKTD